MDVYIVTNPSSGASFDVSFKTGTPQANAYQTINAMPEAAPTLPLNQQYSTADYGQMLINQFTASNTQRDLTSDQLFSLASSLGPFYILLQCGSLQAFLDNLSSVPVDGTVITTAIITQFQAAINAYLAGD
jgi:hypothetical protein